ncbi:FtsK/SpoIIIE domain-containing protein [Glaciibacter psychrotolerans]|uniref:S-DNA-T family DNA segregation ATPase FtsK/SpoIIIE n=1 Tax=Glaciibacter psychrotolerans TaxID=670054 RepID=A0A7Z0EG48_9MICO|nr:FtsK/SpoIIIE domain-containing protein [Leifsonia psychrotolerans]NYJ21048.1 S-DNA-T family DNA segregation ATPase FtsK/SpoIIIE [Leifsonia psychrotolerans]
MKLRVSLTEYPGGRRPEDQDVTLTADVTATVGEVARGLVRAGAGNPHLLPFAAHRHASFTLRATFPNRPVLILDAGDPLGQSGIQSGSSVEPVLESHAGDGQRTRTPVATVTVLTGEQKDVIFLAVPGENFIGRDRGNRIEIHDSSVSRRHAVLRTDGAQLILEDLASANGIFLVGSDNSNVRQVQRYEVTRSCVVRLGDIALRIEVGPPASAEPHRDAFVSHLQSPRVDPVYTPELTALPAPPDPPEPSRFPLIAMLAPLVMGPVLFLATGNMLSLVFVALSPIIMVGTWLDNRLSRGRVYRAKQREFEDNLVLAQEELAQAREVEQAARNAESVPPADLLALPSAPSSLLWTRRPEHRAFLELRLGKATLPSRKLIEVPARGKIPAESWKKLTDLRDQYSAVSDVPVLERMDRCGSLGIAGPRLWSESVARSLLVQLLALHSPADLVLTTFADQQHSGREWAWLKWLPHADSAYSPLQAPHLADDLRSSAVLLTALEGLIATRAQAAKGNTVRSRVDDSASDSTERLTPVSAPAPTPAVIVLVLATTMVDRTRLVGIAEDGADVGVHVIWLAEHLRDVPAACRTSIETREDSWQVHFVRQGEAVALSHLDSMDTALAESFGRAIAPLVDAGARVLDESDFPRSVALGQILPSDVLGASDAVLANWRGSDSLVASWESGRERDPGQLTAIVGQGSSGTVALDLRTHGPHALVGGTTGSGKSEFLQTWILSLAANYSPDRLTFLLVDYKGGAAFADCTDLPHTVGLVTDLNTHLVRRALASLRAELRYREELLAEKGAKDLIALERRSDPDAPPTLVIVIDEFAALVSEIPDFVDGVIDVAQRGRSLGLHLVMATQRPAGVIKDNLRANTNLRIGLRMADPADSSDVLGVTDAAEFAPETPGRGAVKIGAGRLIHFQTGYLGGRSEVEHREPVEIRTLGFGEQEPWVLQPEIRAQKKNTKRGPRDIEALTANIQRAATTANLAAPRKPWVDQLPEVLPLSTLIAEFCTADPSPGIVLGLIDEPHLQRQAPYVIDLRELGNVAIYGGAGSGKTTALLTVAVASIAADPHTQIYGIDAGGGRLMTLTTLSNTGDIVPAEEKDRVVRLLGMLKAVAGERAAAKHESPPILLLIDGFAAFRDTYEHLGGGSTPFADLIEITRAGRNVGMHVVFTCERSGGFPQSLAATIPERLVLRLPAESDYQSLNVSPAIFDGAPAGRAVRIGTEEEIQWALPGASEDPADTETALALLQLQQQQMGIVKPADVPEIPNLIARADISASDSSSVPFAIDTVSFLPIAAPTEGLLLVTGPAGSGRSTAVKSLLEAFAEQARASGQPLDALLISPRRSALRDLSVWQNVADSPDEREAVIERLTLALGGKVRSASAFNALPLIGITGTPEPEPEQVPAAPEGFPALGHRGVVVIEDIGGFDGTGNEQALAQLLKLLRRSELTVIVEGENATLGAVWELASPLRGARWALALQPDANDAPSIFTTPFTHARRANFPPGRGFLATGGRLSGIQIGVPHPQIG